MSTGSVTPFTPNQDTQVVTPGSAANSLITFNPCDALLIWNSGAITVTIKFATSANLWAATPTITNGMPIPPGVTRLVGVPGVIGVMSDPTIQAAILASAPGAGAVYITPGLGTQY